MNEERWTTEETDKGEDDIDSLDVGSLDESANPMEKDLLLWKMFEELLEVEEDPEPFLYFYTWGEPTLTLGKIQSNKEELIKKATELGIPYIERPTGGKAVLHGGDICYTFIAGQNDSEYGGSLEESFEKVSKLISDRLSEVIDISNFKEYSSCDDKDKRAAEDNCFASSVKHESFIEFNNEKHKIIGAAQKMGTKSFIQQGSIQINKVDVDFDLFKNQKTLSDVIGLELDINAICDQLNEEDE